MASSYLGEYQIVLNEFPWFKNLIFRPLAKTFKIEAASLPFTMPCWDQPSSCTYPSYGTLNQRSLYIPDDVYDGLSVKWGNLYNSHIGNFNLVEKWISEPATLVTRQFNVDPVQTPISVFYPHTILKHTIYLHCDVNYFSDIVDSISFYYDNTRGRMRFYPFFPNNIVATGVPAELWDVMFRPEVLVQVTDTASNYVCDCNQMSNSDWFDGGTIDYFQFSYSNSNCGSFNPQLSSVYVNNFTLNAITDEKEPMNTILFSRLLIL